MSKISAAEYPLKEVFSQKFDYLIPSYQRPYAWEETQAGELFDDLFDFYSNKEDKDDTYFLGSIVLIKDESLPNSEVIDGQQRLTTLTILLAIIANQFSDESFKVSFKKYVRQEGDPAEGLKPKPRLALRERDKDFFANSIQSFQFENLLAQDPASFENESQSNIQKNCRLLKSRLDQTFSDDESLLKFGQFIVNECFIVVVSTPSQQSAFRVFSVLNNRGLDLLPSDIIKADVIGNIANIDDKNSYNQIWEDLEVLTGRNGFNDLLIHIRMIFKPEKAKHSILKEFKEVVINNTKSSEDLIDNILKPYAQAYQILKDEKYSATENSDKINYYISWLNKIDNSDWLPVAMKALLIFKNNSNDLLRFFKVYESIAAFLHLTAKTRNIRIDKYSIIINKLDKLINNNISFDTLLNDIHLNKKQKEEFINTLNCNIYNELTARRRNYLILRLDSFISDGLASYKTNLLTIEHVLPQKMTESWKNSWTDEEHTEWLHKLANLVPLSQRRNSQASNYDFETKKNKYFKGSKGVTHYVLTTQIINEKEWTPMVIKERQENLVKVLRENWMLD